MRYSNLINANLHVFVLFRHVETRSFQPLCILEEFHDSKMGDSKSNGLSKLGNIVLCHVSWVGKLAGNMKNVLLPEWPNYETKFWEQSVTYAHKLVNIASIVAKLGNIFFGGKFCVRETKMFLT